MLVLNISIVYNFKMQRPGNLRVTALISGSGGPGWSPGQAHYVVFFGTTLYSHGANSLHPGELGSGEFNAGFNPVMN